MAAWRLAMGDFAHVDGRAAAAGLGQVGGDGDGDGDDPNRPPRPYHMAERRTLASVPAHLSTRWYRMEKTSIEALRMKIGVHFLPKGPGGNPIPPDTIILSSLRHLMGGAAQHDIAMSHGISQAAFSGHFDTFVDKVIEDMADEYLGWYQSEAEERAAKQEFFAKSKIPGIVGIIDGTHIPILAPTGEAEKGYVNRKGGHSINAQGGNSVEKLWLDTPIRFLYRVFESRRG